MSFPEGLGMEPIIRVQVDQDEGVWAECTSAGWYPEPQVEWRDFRGHTLPSVINCSASPTTGLWTVVSNVTLQYGAVKGLSCPIFNPLLLERKVDKIDLPGECSVLAFKVLSAGPYGPGCQDITFWLHPAACGILVPRPGIEPSLPVLEGEVLTTGPPGKSP